jgi:hypothetical protein
MNKRVVRLLGAALLVAGGIGTIYLIARVTHARIEGIFSTQISDAPTNPFERFRCPLILRAGESASVAVTLANPTEEQLKYDVRAEGFGLVVHSPSKRAVTLPAEEVAELTWVIEASARGNQAILVQAFSHKDTALDSTFHAWPTSFGQGCGILVVRAPLSGALTLGLCLAGLLLGAGLSFPRLYARIRA